MWPTVSVSMICRTIMCSMKRMLQLCDHFLINMSSSWHGLWIVCELRIDCDQILINICCLFIWTRFSTNNSLLKKEKEKRKKINNRLSIWWVKIQMNIELCTMFLNFKSFSNGTPTRYLIHHSIIYC